MIPASQPATSRPPKRGADGHDDAGGDLDDADEVHRVLRAAGEQVVELRRQVLRPVVDQDLRELVEPEEDRRDGEDDPQQHEGLRAARDRGPGRAAVVAGMLWLLGGLACPPLAPLAGLVLTAAVRNRGSRGAKAGDDACLCCARDAGLASSGSPRCGRTDAARRWPRFTRLLLRAARFELGRRRASARARARRGARRPRACRRRTTRSWRSSRSSTTSAARAASRPGRTSSRCSRPA